MTTTAIHESFDHIRTWTDPDGNGFCLDLFDTHQTDRYGKSVLAYHFYHKGKLIFEGEDFHCSPCHAIDSDATVGGLLAFLSLKPGDTDDEYFDSYTTEQLVWAIAYGETLSLCADELENGPEPDHTVSSY